jgi:hypothetical protein
MTVEDIFLELTDDTFASANAEALKMKRTIALKMVVLAPAVIVLMILFMASQAPFSG